MTAPFTLFETSWEVGNKVGGIHTVLSTKAKTLVEKLGDRYVCIGPWTLLDPRKPATFEEEKGFEGFAESCRALGVPVRVGRWLIPGRPRTVLVDASGLNAKKDELFAKLWDQYRVDSLFGGWDYVEPALFGHAAGLVIERWWHENVGPRKEEAVAQFHEWMTGTGLLYLKAHRPSIGTVFTTHATVLGRALGATGTGPEEGLAGRAPEVVAEALNVRSKHSLESVCAREADVLTTVSDATAREVDVFLRRRPRPILINGIDLDVVDALAGPTPREEVRKRLRHTASRFLGEDVGDAVLLATSGRYEVHNKGIDVLLEALARVARQPGRKAVMFVLVPAGTSGVRRDVAERLAVEGVPPGGPLGVSTHNLFEADRDPIAVLCGRLGLDNAVGARVKVIHVADYLSETDGWLNLPYEAVLRAMDATMFPSFYEPWGYTPLESIAVGVPTLTTDHAGFGLWALSSGVSPADGVAVLPRRHRTDAEVTAELATWISKRLAAYEDAERAAERCRATASALAWSRVIAHYETAFKVALARSSDRMLGTTRSFPSPSDDLPADSGPHFVAGEVAAALPETLRGLVRLARNMAWCWDPDASAIFRTLSPEVWEACRHNPVALLADVPAADLSAEAADPPFVARVRDAVSRVERYIASSPSVVPLPVSSGGSLPQAGGSPVPLPKPSPERPIAYFCAEFGIHESLPIYNGGLGVLAGDHLKAASDQGLPLVAVGLFYRRGYLRQRVSVLGDQVPLAVENEPRDLALSLARDATGAPVRVELDLPGTSLSLVAWKVQVGRIPLYLLDADLPENRPEDRSITHQLYGGDQELRLRQEIVLGKGGVRLLEKLGIDPCAVHLNEGHAAFAPLERVSRLVHDAGLTFDEAAEIARATTVFTTHTPVPAGHDRFSEALMRRYFSDCGAWIGCPWERFFALGRTGPEGDFNMTYLGLRLSSVHNGVSRLHGDVSRRLLGPYWPGLLPEEIPVASVTNGVHLPTWTSPVMSHLLGAPTRPVTGADFASRGPHLDDNLLWTARREARSRMVAGIKAHLRTACAERHDPPSIEARMLAGVTEDALLVGFARRFATYKRADLLLRDLKRIEKLVERTDRPVRIFFAGKAHPNDKAGQDLLRKVVMATRSDALIGKVFFLDDYDMSLAGLLVQGVDVWLNTPVRLMEASGTSGMKVACNGGLNVSIRDGWWDEGYDGTNGWAIGEGVPASTREVEDGLDADALYALLEDEIVPTFFDRDSHGVPHRWLTRVKRSLATLPPVFDARRMVGQYLDAAYGPLCAASVALTSDGYAGAKALAARHQRVRRAFATVRIVAHKTGPLEAAAAGASIDASADVDLVGLDPTDVAVELVFRPSGAASAAKASSETSRVAAVLEPQGDAKGTVRTFRGVAVMPAAGRPLGAVRVRARADRPGDGSLADLVVWA